MLIEAFVLVILSGEDKVTLNTDRAGSSERTHETGFFLTELMVPLKALLDAGYQPVFATPEGTKPVMDAASDNAFWFGGNEEEYKNHRKICEQLGLCGKGRVGSLTTESFASVLENGLDKYAAVFFPGGHAPMEDLYKNRALGKILQHFQRAQKPTALICHAPIALLSTLSDPEAYGQTLEEINELSVDPVTNKEDLEKARARLSELKANWPYAGYLMTSFSTKEEKQEEPGEDNVLKGYMKFYPDEALDFAGGRVVVRAQKWQSNVVRDRELITGQNPFSDKEFAQALLKALKERNVK